MIIEKIDTWIITRIFDPIAHKVQIRTGHTCYYLAWWCLGLALLIKMVDISRYFRAYAEGAIPPEHMLGFWGVVGPFPIVMIAIIVDLYKTQKLSERKQWQSSALPVKRTPIWIVMRLFMAATAIGICATWGIRAAFGMVSVMGAFLPASGFTLMTIAEYFCACTPLPPSAHKKREAEQDIGRPATVLRRDAA